MIGELTMFLEEHGCVYFM